MLEINGSTNYVFSVLPLRASAVTFRNVTIQEKNNITTAVMTIYTPTKAWIQNNRLGKDQKFVGKVDVVPLNLNGVNVLSISPSMELKESGKLNALKTAPPKIADAQYVCSSVNVWVPVPYQCASELGHWPWDFCNIENPELRPGYTMEPQLQTTCSWVQTDPPPTGIGETTPNPPPGYDPCDTGLPEGNDPPVSTIDDTPCDSGTPNGEINTDSLAKKFPCAKILIIDKLNGVSGFSNLVAPFQGNGEVPNLNWDSSSSLPWGGSTGTYQIGETQSAGWSSTIYISSFAIQNATPLIIATAAIHEAAHAYANYLTKRNIYYPNQLGSWANDIEYWSVTDSLYKAGQGNYIDHSNFLEAYFESMVSILQEFDANSSTLSNYRMAMLYGMNYPGDPPNPNSSSIAEQTAFNKRATKLSSIYNKLLIKYGLTTAQINTFYTNNVTSVPTNKRLPANCP